MGTPLFSKQMSIVIDGSTLGCATDFSLSVDKDLIEIACLESTSKSSVPDLYSWTISFNGMVIRTSARDAGKAGFENLMTKIMSDASIAIYILPNVSTNTYYTGAGYLSNVTMDGGVGSAVTFSGEVTGSTPLTVATTA
jgi:hypothetical protein